MRFTQICAVAAAAAFSLLGQSSATPLTTPNHLVTRQNGARPVTGVRGSIQVRKNIADMTNDELTIFLLGMQSFQSADQRDPYSYYQIAGKVKSCQFLVHLQL